MRATSLSDPADSPARSSTSGTPGRPRQFLTVWAIHEPKQLSKVMQFNWRRHWSSKVAPHLQKELVQASLDLGMKLLDANWKRGDPPFLLGAIGANRIVKGKLSWYQPLNRCHWIAFFAMAIGVLNYPELDWRFLSGDLHTVPIGYGPKGEAKIVMDILLFDGMTAEESVALATRKMHDAPQAKGWNEAFQLFAAQIVPLIRAEAMQDGELLR